MLIGADGARLLENAIAFSSCGEYSGSLFKVLREKQVKGDPAGLMLEEAPDRPRKASAWSGNQQANLTEPFK
jgi:hypothetical protein